MHTHKRRIWTYAGHVPWISGGLGFEAGSDLPGGSGLYLKEVLLKRGAKYMLMGWVSRKPDLSASVVFSIKHLSDDLF